MYRLYGNEWPHNVYLKTRLCKLRERAVKMNDSKLKRDWSLITGKGGGGQQKGGGHVKFYPYEKGGGEF